MTISIKSKHVSHYQRTFNRRLIPAGPLIAAFATASLWLTSCPSPAGTTTYTTTVIGTVTASEPGESADNHRPRRQLPASGEAFGKLPPQSGEYLLRTLHHHRGQRQP